jgi:hypothetical protein
MGGSGWMTSPIADLRNLCRSLAMLDTVHCSSR